MSYIYGDTHTYTGAVVDFTAAESANITSISSSISFSQSLNGYSNPWTADGGANIFGGTKLRDGVLASMESATNNTDEKYVYFYSAASASQTITNNPSMFEEGTQYTFIMTLKKSAGTGTNLQVIYTDDTYDLIPAVSAYGQIETRVLVSAAGKTVASLSKRNASGYTYLYYEQSGIFKGVLTASDFSPYVNYCPISGKTGIITYVSPTSSASAATTYPVSWQTEAGTVYGGTVDIISGKLTVTVMKQKVLSVQRMNGYGMFKIGALGYIDDSYTPSSTLLQNWTGTAATMPDGYFKVFNSNGFAQSQMIFLLPGITATKTAYNAELQRLDSEGTPLEFVYKLATPKTYQLSPKEVATLSHTYIWGNSGNVTVVVSDILRNFQGWLIKVGPNMTLVPTTMIKAETYKVSPNQRMEETAERDSTGVLWRETVPNMPPKIEFNTPSAYDTDVNALNAIFRAAFSNINERKLTVAFYDPEENAYKSWECYMPNIDFPIRTIDIEAKTIFYDEIRYAFIGY